MRSLVKISLIFLIYVVVVVAGGAVEKSTTTTTKGEATTIADNKHIEEYEIKIYKRLIPADVLRDFPGMCFASTRCATVEPGKTWELTPFCGRSTCVQHDEDPSRLLELVEDCGPLPLANDKCKLDTDKTNKTASFPYCCPIFTCESGVQLEYPDIPLANNNNNNNNNNNKSNDSKNEEKA